MKAQTYKADFEEERRDREVAAGRKEVEISQYRDRILQLEDLVRSLKEEKQSSDKSLHEFKHGKSHDVSYDRLYLYLTQWSNFRINTASYD